MQRDTECLTKKNKRINQRMRTSYGIEKSESVLSDCLSKSSDLETILKRCLVMRMR